MADAPAPPDPHDRQVLARVADGDRAALGLLVDRHQDSVMRFARSLVRTDAEAEDVLQETFLAALRGAAGYRGDGSVRGWLLTIARHTAYRRRRREAIYDHEEDHDLERLGAEAGFGDLSPSPLEALTQEEARKRVQRALARLDEVDREVLVLRDIEGLDGAQTAEVLGLGLAAMKSRLHRARLRIAALLRDGEEDRHGA
jgi:RNA polymerase sigma-70 factor (ECF subfamily)